MHDRNVGFNSCIRTGEALCLLLVKGVAFGLSIGLLNAAVHSIMILE